MKRLFFPLSVMFATFATVATAASIGCGDGKPAEAPPPAPPLTPVKNIAAPVDTEAPASMSTVTPVASAPPTNTASSAPTQKCVAGTFDNRGCLAASKAAPANATAEAELTQLVAAMQKIFPDASKKKCPAKTSDELFGEHGKWNELGLKASDFDHKLTAVGQKIKTPHALAMSTLESGLMFARLAMALRACTEDNVELFTAKQRDLVKTMATSGRDDLKEKAEELQTSVKEAFRARKDTEGTAVDTVATKRILSGVALANAYGFGDAAVSDAWNAWSDLRVMMGPRANEYIESTRDPMDPDGSRSIALISDSFAPRWVASLDGRN